MRMNKITLVETLIEKRKGLRIDSQGIPTFRNQNIEEKPAKMTKYV